MDEAAVRALLAVAGQDDDAPPCGVSVPLALSRGRRRLRLLRVYLPGAAPVAAGVVVALVIALPAAVRSSSPEAGAPQVRVTATAPAAAPRHFNPLVPYASFGWLPAGFATTAAVGASDESTPAGLTLQAFAPVSDGRMVQVTIDAAGACRIVPTPAGIARTTAPARSLSCTDPSPGGVGRLAELAAAAPDVTGGQAYWTPQGALEWQYAAGGWGEVMPMANPQVCVHCAPNSLAGWRNVPALAGRARLGQATPARAAAPQSAASRALLLKIAASIRYGDTTPLVFGFQLAGLPAEWHVADDYYFAPLAGRLVAGGISAGPAVDPTALGVSVGPAVSPASEYACKVVAGQTGYVTVNGAPALLRNLNEPDKQWQSLCMNNIGGVSAYVALDLNSPGSTAPLPGTEEFSSVLTVFRSVHLLGGDPAAWTTDPLN